MIIKFVLLRQAFEYAVLSKKSINVALFVVRYVKCVLFKKNMLKTLYTIIINIILVKVI